VSLFYDKESKRSVSNQKERRSSPSINVNDPQVQKEPFIK